MVKDNKDIMIKDNLRKLEQYNNIYVDVEGRLWLCPPNSDKMISIVPDSRGLCRIKKRNGCTINKSYSKIIDEIKSTDFSKM